MLIICVFQQTEIVWACSGNPLRLVTSLSVFLFCGNRQRHTGYQETEHTSEWWAAYVSFPQVSARILHRSTSLSVTDCHSGHDAHSLTTVRLQLFISLSLNSSLPGTEKVWSWAQPQGLTGYLENHVEGKVGAWVLTQGEDVCVAYGPNLGQEAGP